jgi:glutathione S-transferase
MLAPSPRHACSGASAQEAQVGIVKLYSARACPFAHRTRLVLSHKNVGFEVVEIDLQQKPSWFDRDVSAYGKVPAIAHDDQRLWESAIINEYLDETFPRPPLLPAQPGRRALARIWIDYANARFAPAFGTLLRAKDADAQASARQTLAEVLTELEERALGKLSAAGPFFFGATPTLVDFAFYPWFERWAALSHYRDFPVPQELKRLARFRQATRELEAVKAHENPDDYYIARYAKVVM